MAKQSLGYLFAVLNMVTYGLLPVFAHYFVTTLHPLVFGGATALVGSLPFLFFSRNEKRSVKIYLKPLFIIGIIELLATITFFVGTKFTSGINTGLLLQLEPFYGILLAALFLGEIVRLTHVLATVLMVFGAFIVVYKGVDQINIGDLLIFVTPALYQISNTVAKSFINKLRNVSIVPAAKMFISGIGVLLIALLFAGQSINQLFLPQNIISILFFAFIFRTLDQVTWYQAIKYLPLSKASSIIPLSVVVSFFGSMIFLKETPNIQQYFGLFFIGGGLLWFSILHFHIADSKNKK